MKGSTTITAFFPTGLGDLKDITLEDEDDTDPETPTRVSVPRSAMKTIPFGSTLDRKPLRVGFSCGAVLLLTPDGHPIGINHLPKWEARELFKHVESALEAGSL